MVFYPLAVISLVAGAMFSPVACGDDYRTRHRQRRLPADFCRLLSKFRFTPPRPLPSFPEIPAKSFMLVILMIIYLAIIGLVVISPAS